MPNIKPDIPSHGERHDKNKEESYIELADKHLRHDIMDIQTASEMKNTGMQHP